MRHHWFDHWCSGNIIWGICSCILNHLKVFYWVLTGISSGKMASKLHSWKDRICIIWTQHCFFFFARKHLFFKKNNVISKGFLPNFIIIHWKFYSIISKKRKLQGQLSRKHRWDSIHGLQEQADSLTTDINTRLNLISSQGQPGENSRNAIQKEDKQPAPLQDWNSSMIPSNTVSA